MQERNPVRPSCQSTANQWYGSRTLCFFISIIIIIVPESCEPRYCGQNPAREDSLEAVVILAKKLRKLWLKRTAMICATSCATRGNENWKELA